MLRNIALVLVATLALTACVAPQPRQHVVYRETTREPVRVYHEEDRPVYREDRDEAPARVYREERTERTYSDDRYADRGCRSCGTVRDVARVEIRQGTTGGGAVLGAIIGGLVGNQFGHGSGKAATTAAGVVGGAAVGNSIEQNEARAGSGNAWRFRVELDDGHWATVTQYQNPGVHPGDRVVIRGDHIELASR